MKVMQEATAGVPRVLDNPAPDVTVKGLVDNGVELQLGVWVNDPENGSASLQSVLYLNILKAFRANQITIPLPSNAVTSK